MEKTNSKEYLVITIALLEELISLNNSKILSFSRLLKELKTSFEQRNLKYKTLKDAINRIREVKKGYLESLPIDIISRKIYIKTSVLQAQIEIIFYEIHKEIY